MNIQEIFNYIKSTRSDLQIELQDTKPQPSVIVNPGQVVEFAQFIKSDKNLLFDMYLCNVGVDYIRENMLESINIVFSTKYLHKISFKVRIPRDNPKILSLAGVWPAADWHERETYDLLGIEFIGHPFLKRILLPEDWEGYPLRKDYTFPKSYRDIPLT